MSVIPINIIWSPSPCLLPSRLTWYSSVFTHGDESQFQGQVRASEKLKSRRPNLKQRHLNSGRPSPSLTKASRLDGEGAFLSIKQQLTELKRRWILKRMRMRIGSAALVVIVCPLHGEWSLFYVDAIQI